jgi:protein O-GlcNAc transferase
MSSGILHDIDRAVTLHTAGRVLDALRIYRTLALDAPAGAVVLHLLGVALHQLGRSVHALPWLDRAATLIPTDPGVWHNRGEALRALGRLHEAAAAYRAALRRFPGMVESHNALALTLHDVAAPDEALTSVRRALVLDPGHARSHNTAGLVRSAPLAFRRALAIDPFYSDVWGNFGGFALGAGAVASARTATSRALALDPKIAECWSNLAGCFLPVAMPQDAVRYYRRALSIRPLPVIHSNLIFALLYDPHVGASELHVETRRWESWHVPPSLFPGRHYPNAPDPDRRLRVGYLSKDLRDHPVARNVEGLLAHHDPHVVEAYGYAEVAAPDDTTRRLMNVMPHWRTVVGLSHDRVADLIRADGIDILVVLAGHAGGNRLAVCGRRPAPIQVSFHDVVSSGVAAVDYWLTDSVLHPPDSTEMFVERLVPLPVFYLCQLPIVPPAPTPRKIGDGVLFGSFNNPAKVGPDVVQAWARILASTPGSRLLLGYHAVLADPAVAGHFRGAFRRHGIDDGRVTFAGSSASLGTHLARVSCVDVALDPFPFNGSTTTFEALCMGVPVVTLAGSRFVGRVGASLLHGVGLPELVATTPEEYVDLATSLARDVARRASLSRELPHRVITSPLCDAPAHARSVEAAYRWMWRSWCERVRST